MLTYVSGRQNERVNDIPRTEGGIPILPAIDVNWASMGELVQILHDYYATLWGKFCVYYLHLLS
jgi:hypothetical protein